MPILKNLLTQLHRSRTQAENELKRLNAAITTVSGLLGRRAIGSRDGAGRGRRRMSAAGRARIAAAQRARWSKVKQGKGKTSKVANKPTKKVRRISAAARRRIAAAQRARWAKVRQQQKSGKKSAESKAQAEKK
jgi:hypothetical protein